jgi:putative transposase
VLYRRACIPGGSYFFTVVTHQRRKLFTGDTEVDCLRHAFRTVKHKHPFSIDAIVILPDHLHCIWTLPADDADFARRWRLIKSAFTKQCPSEWRTVKPDVARTRKGQQAIWQHRYWEHMIRDEADFRAHVDYIHYNPVHHRYVSKPADWIRSSFGLYVQRGMLNSDWGASGIELPDSVGRE